ncbi:MAG: hypothetical protein KDJ29_08505 [Hyphomicrobiales bacterium]|nr:hypothetical protein [Hyphomicrobiales bacterium]
MKRLLFKRFLPQFRESSWLAVVTICWIWIVGPGSIEGRLFPVVAPMQLERTELYQGGTKVWGQSEVLRPSCSFRKIRWFLGTRDGRNVPVTIDTGPAVVRDGGRFTFGPWEIGIWPEALISSSYADVYHRCRIAGVKFPWMTKTRFWN